MSHEWVFECKSEIDIVIEREREGEGERDTCTVGLMYEIVIISKPIIKRRVRVPRSLEDQNDYTLSQLCL
jgi:hypothetical protein